MGTWANQAPLVARDVLRGGFCVGNHLSFMEVANLVAWYLRG
jgi:hypothetical protein